MCGITADRAVGLAQDLDRRDRIALADYSSADIRDFLAQGRRCRRLAMRAR